MMKKSLLVSLLLTVLPSLGWADDPRGASPRWLLIELKLSPWQPMLDVGQPAQLRSYERMYGTAPMLLGEAELDFEVWKKIGTLSVGVSGGYAEKFAKAFLENDDGTTSTERSNETSGFRVVPLKLLLTYRFDYLWTAFDVPLVPYLKAGPVFAPWWVTKGADVEVVFDKTTMTELRGAGYKFGISGTVGVSFVLDFLDRRLARDFDSTVGVNHTSLFAEFTLQKMGLAELATNAAPINLSSNHWNFGISFEL